MSNYSQGKIGIREFVSLILLSIGSKLTDMTPAIIFNHVKQSTWMVPIFSLIIIAPSLFILLSLFKRYKDKNLYDIIVHLFGKYIGFIVGILLFIIVIEAIITSSRSYSDILGTMYFTTTPLLAIYGVFIGVSYMVAKMGLEAIGSSAYLTIPYIKVTLLLLGILGSSEGVFGRAFPLLGDGVDVILKESLLKSSIFGDIFVLTMIYPLVMEGKNFRKGLWMGLVITAVEISFFIFVYAIVFLEKIAYPFHELARYVRLGTYFTNIETLFLGFWLIAALIRFAIYLYIASLLFGAIFKIKEFEPILLPLTIIVILAGMLPENPIYNVLHYRDMLLNIDSFFFLGLPIVLWLTAKWKGDLST
ncbi:GerAB/ArcD/ProY family transporter [Ammoniphilus sp. CFH 90114]|uniref:GerAB/ArcD/ProY family transporter n=1 Tax=Ammoniphilus sp. CFH 90114 TaxID=2493665 RepID=UPI00100E33FD|nr:GerAB/ArcD/ProY family transporter [Ammoniphilus sp. CFH 90114]RXT08950.1 spore gernimation protein [Ammoniphilus sp. CFH 90114]